MPSYNLDFIITLPVPGDCALRGATADGVAFVEIYPADDDARVYRIASDGDLTIQDAADPLPETLHTPHLPLSHPLDYSGGRWRGLREYEPVGELAQPMTIQQKMALLDNIDLNATPMTLLGVIESKVLSTTTITDDTTIVCRRVRLAYALSETHRDTNGQPYDYDSRTLYLTHEYTPDAADAVAPSLAESVGNFGGASLSRPHDCLLLPDDRLLIADVSDGSSDNRLLYYTVSR